MLKMEEDLKLECAGQGYLDVNNGWPGAHNAARTTVIFIRMLRVSILFQDYAACGGSGYVGENWSVPLNPAQDREILLCAMDKYSSGPDDGFGGATYDW